MSQSQKDVGQTHDMLQRLQNIGIDREDAWALRRISMTLHRWHEMECGDSNDHSSWVITRGNKTSERVQAEQGLNVRKDTFSHDENGKPYLERHYYPDNAPTQTTYNAIPDRERGALKRLAAITARYPGLTSYVQTDPRGASLYILRPSDMVEGASIDSFYSRGIAVFK